MREYKIYLASALFICLSAVKLCFPQIPAQLRRETAEILCSEKDYGATVQALGRSLAQGRLEDRLVQVLEYIGPHGGQSIPSQEALNTPIVSDTGDVDLEDPESETLQAAEDPLPDNVSLDVPRLPFEYSCPVTGTVSSCFGPREDPLDSEPGFHYGTDFAADSGDSVLAFAQGVVNAAGTDEGYGNYCIIEHSEGYSTLYAHLSECVVREGQEVEMGQLIGYVGQTGRATGPHLHFELSCNGMYLDPESYL